MIDDAVPEAALADFLPRLGSDVYYALRYAPAPERARLALLEGLRGAIAGIPITCSDPTVAHAKLNWWHEEIARLGAGAARHVLTRALESELANLPGLASAAQALVEGVHALLTISRHATRAARFAAFDAAHGPLWEIANARTAALEPAAAEHARRLGSRVEEAYALRDTRRFVTGGAALLAQDTVTAVTERAGAELDDAEWYARVIAVDIADCRAALVADLASLPARRRLRPLATLARLAGAALDEVVADGCRVWERRVELTALRKLGIALRERWRR